MGTPDFSVPVLKGLVEKGYEVKAVVTQPDKKVGRKQKITKTPAKLRQKNWISQFINRLNYLVLVS